MDNCQFVPNTDQANNDGDTPGDVCDPDDDNDGVTDTLVQNQTGNFGLAPTPANAGVMDNCQFIPNTNQVNNDMAVEPANAKVGDVCDPDDDNDTVTDFVCTVRDDVPGSTRMVQRRRHAAEVMDNCQFVPNANQANNDGDTPGDVCDTDDDNDTITDTRVVDATGNFSSFPSRRPRWA